MKLFAEHFRQHVTAKLRWLASIEATLVLLDVVSFSDARSELLRFARSRGALSLPENVFEDLEDWIDTELLRAIDAQERRNG